MTPLLIILAPLLAVAIWRCRRNGGLVWLYGRLAAEFAALHDYEIMRRHYVAELRGYRRRRLREYAADLDIVIDAGKPMLLAEPDRRAKGA